MNLCYFKGDIPNFGDDLNPYIIYELIPHAKSIQLDTDLLVIGTILSDDFFNSKGLNTNQEDKIVFGSGIRFMDKVPKFDDNWKFRFVRGPFSAVCIKNQINQDIKYITDPAYLIRETSYFKNKKPIKKHKISVMPHFRSLNRVDWKHVCDTLGYHFIDPSYDDVEVIMDQILESEFLLTEAMHGAILADAFQVPWLRFKYFSHFHEQNYVSEFKWSDWLFSMGLKHNHIKLDYNRYIRVVENNLKRLNFKKVKENQLIKQLKSSDLGSINFQLSDSNLVQKKTDEMMVEIERLKEN
ncbi:polysaccharide pyruvyl transferase family protein [Mangrovimonas sp. YM274]|uniref:polysaccharide pyruvyl transferase family protein n=1 Tax=Mangrovimonas sp. YM274 TaxID=3070660 RepID=UPI0027DAD070|nr:polysaccharide pyruvyl transferase family protein [Mangrovimonas sp. YM274]WMI68452.1 polysaccharide pyruvyl transferase family protein [Mangrovimonas sp. YM274]